MCHAIEIDWKHLFSFSWKGNKDLSVTTFWFKLCILRIVLCSDSHLYEDCIAARAFRVAAPTLWNNLPIAVKHSTSLYQFCRLLKGHLFSPMRSVDHQDYPVPLHHCRYSQWITAPSVNVTLIDWSIDESDDEASSGRNKKKHGKNSTLVLAQKHI